MFDEEMKKSLEELQKELSTLKNTAEIIKDTQEDYSDFVQKISAVQNSYEMYSKKLFDLCKDFAEDLKKRTENEIGEGVLRFEKTGNTISSAYRETTIKIQRLLEQYSTTVESSNTLIERVNSVDFPERFRILTDTIAEKNRELQQQTSADFKELNEKIASYQITDNFTSLSNSVNNLLVHSNESTHLISAHLIKQDKEIRTLKVFLFISTGFAALGVALSLFALWGK